VTIWVISVGQQSKRAASSKNNQGHKQRLPGHASKSFWPTLFGFGQGWGKCPVICYLFTLTYSYNQKHFPRTLAQCFTFLYSAKEYSKIGREVIIQWASVFLGIYNKMQCVYFKYFCMCSLVKTWNIQKSIILYTILIGKYPRNIHNNHRF